MYHLSTVSPETYSLLKRIFQIEPIRSSFALAGGTSLALQIGHRKSIDLDLFTTNNFNPKEIEIILVQQPDLKFIYAGNNSRMLFSFINNIKCDFVQEPAPLLHPFVEKDGINYFSIEDIAAMKMHTICGRGKRKDFFDIYALLQTYKWTDMLQWFANKYGENQFYFLWKSIGYFADADSDGSVKGISPYDKSWEEIKKYISEKCIQI